MKRFLTILLMLILCACFLEGCVTATTKPEPEEIVQEPVNPVINSELIKTQQEIVELRQKIFNDTQIKIENAQATLHDLIDARAKLAEAKIKLAEFQDRNDLLVQELQTLVQFYINARGKFLEQLESGQGKGKELYEIEIALKETNIRLTQIITNLYPSGVQGKEQ
ncbi:MAG: hypothetical protein JXA96_14330 [Sedimentisphaerales bacterium]|nr:hypothetical protein [Sedimentisphaerales bacterium]